MNPKVAMLRISLAELEEMQENYDNAKETYKTMFNSIPCGFTFGVLQRYIRRKDGINEARNFFNETFSLRQQDKKLAYEV